MRNFAKMTILIGALGLVAASPASGAVTIGQAAPGGGAGDCGGPNLYVTSQVAPGSPSYAVPPGGGVLTEWSAGGGNVDSTLELKVVEQTAPMTYRIVATDVPRTLLANTVNDYSIRIPVSGGELLSMWVSVTGQFCAYPSDPGDVTQYATTSISPEPNVGDSVVTGATAPIPVRINASAVLEADADQDGFGDETQDQCPTDATTQGTCPPDADPPKAEITKRPKNKLEKSKAKFKFTSNEPGSTFECKKDKKPWRLCTSPTKMKRLDEGKHRFKVRATDPAGNTGTPAKDKFKVVD